METWHVLPVDDIKEHEESEYCHCKPSVEYEDNGRVIVHNSFDGRELTETDEHIKN